MNWKAYAIARQLKAKTYKVNLNAQPSTRGVRDAYAMRVI